MPDDLNNKPFHSVIDLLDAEKNARLDSLVLKRCWLRQRIEAGVINGNELRDALRECTAINDAIANITNW